MKKLFLMAGLAGAAILGMAGQANAEEGWYVKASAGQAFHTEANGFRLSDDMTFGADLGLKAGPWRFEAGAHRLSADTNVGFTTINASALDYEATVYLDVDVSRNASLYVGAGVDRLQAEATAFSNTFSSEGNGYHLTAGGAVRATDHIIIEAQVSRLECDDLSFSGNAVNLTTYAATVGLRYQL